jgi:nitrogen PTS system EIIA component
MLMNQEDKSAPLKVMDILHLEAIQTDLSATTKRAVLEELVEFLMKTGKIKNAPKIVEVLMEREKLGSTGIGQGIAIPHAKTDDASEVIATLGLSRKGVQFDALDGEPVHIVFLLVAPPEAAAPHLKALARISRLLKNKFFRQSLRAAKDTAEVIRLIREEDQY